MAAAFGTTAPTLKANPLPYIRHCTSGRSSNGHPIPPLPSPGHIGGWHSRLLSSIEPLDYLLNRGLGIATIERYRLGYDGTDLIFPVFMGGELVNVRRRRPVNGANPRGLRGRGAQMYPNVPSRGVLVLVAGEFDALVCQQHRVRTVTTTCGCRLPDYLVPQLAERPVAVAYDVGEEVAAWQTVVKLRAVGSEAWVVRLGLLGLPPDGDLNDYYRDGGSTRELLALIRRERGAS